MGAVRRRLRSHNRGHAALEVALLGPWIFFLFAGAFDMGFFAYSLISAQNAARVAAEYTSTSSTTAVNTSAACRYVLDEMNGLSNVRSLASCGALPLMVTASAVVGPDGTAASAVSVTYRSDMLIPIPGLSGRLTVTRRVVMMLKNL